MADKPIIFALPKGRIYEELEPILSRVGITPEDAFFDSKSRALKFETNNPLISIIRVRSFDVATFVGLGAAQIGVVGSDVLDEFDYPDIYAPIDLGIGKCRLSVAEPTNLASNDDPSQWSHIRIATKYPNLTKAYFSRRGVQAECIKLNGAMELAPTLGMCERIVDLVSTGSTLKANGLVEVETLLEVSSRLIVNRSALKTQPEQLSPLIRQFEEVIHDLAA